MVCEPIKQLSDPRPLRLNFCPVMPGSAILPIVGVKGVQFWSKQKFRALVQLIHDYTKIVPIYITKIVRVYAKRYKNQSQ